tara:strand:+ start:4989 stop:5540 length:552 start_codon:yes stop_codon:yes gene_type:complete
MARESRIDLEKKVYSKTGYPRIIDTKFTQLGVKTINESIASTPTVNEFFNLYNSLFYEIPAFGDSNSHQYLIETSADYIDYNQSKEEIEALQKEITQLRKDLLQAELEKVEALTGEKLNLDIDTIDEAQVTDSSQFTDLLNSLGNQPTSPTEENTTATNIVTNSPTPTSGGGAAAGGGGGGGY